MDKLTCTLINLSANNLRSINPSLFLNPHLETLIINENHITELPNELGKSQKLRVLQLVR